MGFLRLFLALSVIAGHSGSTVFGFHGISAFYAVNFFFIISGFYMAMILNEQYKTMSVLNFYKSRALRLFPTYYFGILISLAVSFVVILSTFNDLTPLTKSFFIFQNIFIFGQDLSYLFCSGVSSSNHCLSPISMTINPPAWSLSVELGFYLIAPFFLKSGKKTGFLIIIGCIYLLLINALNFPLKESDFFRAAPIETFYYFYYPSSFIFFGGGALAYHLTKQSFKPNYIIAIAILGALSFTITIMPFWHLLFFSLAIPVLFEYTKNNKIDRIIGELSYPAYILHFPILIYIQREFLIYPVFFEFLSIGTWVAIFSCAFGLFVYFFIDKRINNYRRSKVFLKKENNDSSKRFLFIIPLLYILTPFFIISILYYTQSNYISQPDYTAYNLTDNNWDSGVSRNEAAFFVLNNESNNDTYKIGRAIRFNNGETRDILKIIKTDNYMNIYLSGEVLNARFAGYPNEIIISN